MNTLFTTTALMGVMRDKKTMTPPTEFWLGFFPNMVVFETEEVDFGKIARGRKLAPLVVPTAQGVPIYNQAEKRTSFKPAYVKPKDPVSAARMIRRQAGLGEMSMGTAGLSPEQRFKATTVSILVDHDWAIRRRWEWMAAQATLNGSVTLSGENYPTQVVDFQRDPTLTVSKAPGTFWGEPGVSIMDDLEQWSANMIAATDGSAPRALILTSGAWSVFRKDQEVKDLLDTRYRQNTGADLKLGITTTDDKFVYKGTVNGDLDVWVYYDTYEDDDGNEVPFMQDGDICMVGDLGGFRCFGAILDKKADLKPMAIFPKMWEEEDPSVTFIMNQSAPLMVPTRPNGSMKATVLPPPV